MTYIIAEPCVDVKDTACVEVCPEAFSQIAPPERCWLLGLREADPAGAADPGEVTGLVALQGHDLCILLW